ncbi:hypothetical protein [Hyphomonas chukchiensis]|uniref:Uncharacterized protein n=1 Tax=Hyphomonas chukchiensis TaxID=1280947 RepID=A0A062UIL4_9PROT|nr:hypothetical protein [Hyphomonas chukchiensis]KCZ58851.1 hypothetical protein HY30_03695 [Hyphomonas chukchiensis]
MYIKSKRWLIYAAIVLLINIFGFLALAMTQIMGPTGEVEPLMLLPSLLLGSVGFWFCCWKAVGLRH